MDQLLKLQQKLMPDVIQTLTERYRILRFLRLMQPIGRRTLANNLNVSERVLRSEVTFLKEQGLVYFGTSGMTLTEQGHNLLVQLEDVMHEVFDLADMEAKLAKKLGISNVYIVPGDSDFFPWVKKEMGKKGTLLLKNLLKGEKDVIAVTGGTTIASVAEMMETDSEMQDTLFVPARGGLGEQVENQANTICATMARKAMGQYRLLHVPDQLSKEAHDSLIQESSIRQILELIRSANIVIHGIGQAKTMAERRKTPENILNKLQDEQAVAEAFGYYFNHSGDIIHKVRTIGLQLEDLKHIPDVIAVAGGKSKAQAIYAYITNGPSQMLVTDEGAATEMLNNVD
ncbi:sugar-binding transcriptional regulator [Texcoconibacillus texcoconensis]|uniref:Central glycolytic genes regulator n=1 Tax=Texcoconibacillus texcoconensis TaxID=1095777 RepID=A0A840QQ28_9BACI|nr:sugar-binding domain-containing protein [Texcoconibacillus texcoconensis]MBB5173459.1 central glycolytic genes regulator [Texcoconibacillus texcoconensis]